MLLITWNKNMSPGCKHPCAVEDTSKEADLSAQLPSVLVKSFSHSPAPSALTELTSAFIAYKLEVSLHPPQSRACWTHQPHLYSIFLFYKIWLLTSTQLTPSLQLMQLTHPCDSLNFAPGSHLSGERTGKDWVGCLQPGSRRWRQLMASILSSHQPPSTEKTEPPSWHPQCQEADLLHLLLIAASEERKDFTWNAPDPTGFSQLFSGPITHNPCVTWGWSHSEAPM